MVSLAAGAVLLLALATKARAVAASSSAGSRILFRERANGVHPSLQWLLDEWERDGTHTIVIAGGDWPYPGGLRTVESQQAAAAAAGLSEATDLRSTPHGRGAALDVWPQGFRPDRSYAEQDPSFPALMRAFGDFAKSRGFEWGGDFPKADDPHVQIPNWQSLPFPPPDYS